ncbi:MAG: efflux RND transporter periplasmic adaptor subunit [Deltaproteobacteria bacterium]|nr:efflux RND transporter periplasmic adaptor subunit [Deltaproteobacteria bacterium]
MTHPVPRGRARRLAFALLVLTGLVLAACPSETAPEPSAVAKDTQLYTCGMHPEVINEGPGQCPICGMDLTPLRTKPGAGKSTKRSMVTIDPVVVQNMGVRLTEVKRGPVFRHVRTLGEIEVAEDEVSVVNLRYSGWVETIRVDETGSEVKRGQTLFGIYSPEVVTAQEELLLALRTEGPDGPRVRGARARLQNWNIPRSVIAAVEKDGVARRTVPVLAPRSGYVLHKNVVEGARINAGTDLYRIGSLQSIWVRTEVYEHDAAWVRAGQKAWMELSFAAGRQIVGEVDYVYPTLNARSRTLTVRLEFPNPGLELKPGMFATVLIETRKKEDALFIPTEAIIHSGERQLVFVARGIGKYEPRDIDTGVVGDRHITEVLSGLRQGERVVLSGQFLLDSESQLQEAINKLLEARLHGGSPAADPHAGHDHGAEDAMHTCPMHPEIEQMGPGSCPICGMDLVPMEPEATQPAEATQPGAAQ